MTLPRWRVPALLAAGAAAAAVAVGLGATGALDRVESLTFDARMALRGDRAPDGRVAIVGIDQRSEPRLPRGQLPRTLEARVIRRLTAAGARVVALDLRLEKRSSREDDRRLVAALGDAGRAVVSVVTVDAQGRTLPLVGRFAFSPPAIRPGVTLWSADGDGAVRRYPRPLAGVAPFGTAAAAAFLGREVSVPSHAYFDYAGSAGTVPEIAFVDVLAGRFDHRLVRDHVVVIGNTAPALQDLHRTPLDGVMSGPEIQATAVATALRGFPLRDIADWIAAALTLAAALAVCVTQAVTRRRWSPALAAFFVAVAWLAVMQALFSAGHVANATTGLVAIVLSGGASAAVEAAHRRHLRHLFANADQAVIDAVLRDGTTKRNVLAPDTIVPGYVFVREIGRGGMGVVYQAHQPQLHRGVAIKVIRADLGDDPTYRTRFLDEARLAAQVTHPGVLPIFEARQQGGVLYLVMAFVESAPGCAAKSLRDVIGPGGLPADEVLVLLAQIAAALDAAHAKGVVHRDVKPANILLLDHRTCYLADFGIAQSAGGRPTDRAEDRAGTGTPEFMSPQQARGEDPTPADDIFSLAAVLFTALTGHRPSRLRDADYVLPDPRFDAVLRRGLSPDPADRPLSAGALIELAEHAARTPPAASPSGAGTRPTHPDQPTQVGPST